MRKEKKFIVPLTTVFGLIIVFVLNGCVSSQDTAEKADLDSKEITVEEIKPIDLSKEKADDSDWIEYQCEYFSFSHPKDWQIEVVENPEPEEQAIHYIRVKNTEKDIVLGGAAPDDYYVEKDGAYFVNTEKYAEEYMLISVDIYKDENLGWQEFFNQIYPDVVLEFEDYQIQALPSLEAVRAKKVSGVYNGEPRFFARKNERFYDVALYYKGFDEKEAKKIFNTFLVNFSF